MRGQGSYFTKEEMQGHMPPGHRPSYLCIEDPLVPGNDVGKSSYGALQVKQAFDWAYSQLSRAVRQNCGVNTVLSRIVQIDADTINYRNWIKINHPLEAGKRTVCLVNCSVQSFELCKHVNSCQRAAYEKELNSTNIENMCLQISWRALDWGW